MADATAGQSGGEQEKKYPFHSNCDGERWEFDTAESREMQGLFGGLFGGAVFLGQTGRGAGRAGKFRTPCVLGGFGQAGVVEISACFFREPDFVGDGRRIGAGTGVPEGGRGRTGV